MPLSLKQTAFKRVFNEHLDDLMDFKITRDDLVNIVRQKGVPEAALFSFAKRS